MTPRLIKNLSVITEGTQWGAAIRPVLNGQPFRVISPNQKAPALRSAGAFSPYQVSGFKRTDCLGYASQ